MLSLSQMKPLHAVIGIVAVFLLWSVISMGWYVCGVYSMCSVNAEAHDGITHDDAGAAAAHALAETQAPLAVGYDRAGAAGEIFVMLMIAFTLGALMGRILGVMGSAPAISFEHTKVAPLRERVGAPTPLEAERGTSPRPLTGPVHISELTKRAPRPAAWTKPIAPTTAPVAVRVAAPAPVIHLPPQAPIMQIKPPAYTAPKPPAPKAPERPKVRFNTSWSNPDRESKQS